MSDNEFETSQLLFYIEKEIVMSELKEILEKTTQLEKLIRMEIETDSFRPSADMIYPPKKKMRA